MNVFADLHHTDLYYSLQLLFEKRLGWNLYRPIGESWFTEGFWKIAEPYGNHPDTIRQFLSTESRSWESYVFLNGDYTIDGGIYYIKDPISGGHQKAITLDKFKEMDIDIVISSIPAHDFTFEDLIKKHKPKAKHIAQIGNIGQTTHLMNVMCSGKSYPDSAGSNVVYYHQEFDLDVFKPTEYTGNKRISSFVNILPEENLFNAVMAKLPEYKFNSYGACCRDGTITGHSGIASIMGDSQFGWHIKPGGDGFGHIIHNWLSCGRPVITRLSDYCDKLAGDILIDGETCIDEGYSGPDYLASKILEYSEPTTHAEMCKKVYNKFKEVVDFDREEVEIRNFLERLL